MGRLEEFLKRRKQDNLFRELKPAAYRAQGKIVFNGKEYFDFSSNDYLGLSNHPFIKNAAQKALEQYGTGAAASRLLSGSLTLHSELERRVALFKGKESALVFNSGYQANVGIISALVKKNDAVFIDRLSHASIVDGALLSGARLHRFRHNDFDHLETLLKKERDKFSEALIVTETVFSMDGDIAPLAELADLKEKYDCRLLVDEAHATGIFGENGGGMVTKAGLTEKVDLIMGTFSKALGSFGAYLACSDTVKVYLVNRSRGFIYSTALPPAVIAANLASLEVAANEPERRKTLLANADYLRNALKQKGLRIRGETPIIPVIIGDAAKTSRLSKKLQEKGHWAPPIRPPTVAANEARLRLSVTYYHDRSFLDKLIEDFDALI